MDTLSFLFSPAGFAGASWVTILWVTIVSICLTLSAVNGMVWLRQRDARDSLMFSLLALSTGLISVFDYAMMRAPDPEVYGEILRWYHVPVLFAFAATIGFVYFYLQSGRLWLAIAAFSLRAFTLALNFLEPVNLNFKELSTLRSVSFLGESVSMPAGTVNPLMSLGQLSLLLLLVYAVDASVGCWKKGQKRRAITAGGSLAVFIALSSWQTALVYLKVIQMPVMAGMFFLGVVAVMAYELSRELIDKIRVEMELQQRQREIARMNRISTMGVLAASLAHELNQPLAAILSNARAAGRLIARPDPDIREIASILDDIAAEDQRAARVIQSLRAMMTNEPVKWSPVQVNQLVDATLHLVESELRARAIILQRNLAPGLPPVPGDAVQLQQVLLNLMVNAMQAIDRGGRIAVQTSLRKDLLRVAIHDSGPGIPPDKLPVIFDPFISLKQRGMGMGLTVCREIIKHHGGTLRGENHPDGGALFCFELPLTAIKRKENSDA